MGLRVRLLRLWESITEPRYLKVAYLVIYLLTIGVGVVTAVHPPQSIQGPLGPILTGLWAWLFIVGGAVGAVTVLPGWWWLERLLALGPIVMGLGIYFVVAFILHWQSAADGGSRLTQVGIILLASAAFNLRGLLIREYSYEPRRG